MLTNFEDYPNWNPFIVICRISGQVKVGAKLEVYLQPPGAKGMTFRPTVLNVESNREFRWLGKLILPGLFDGEHVFQMEPLDNGHTRFIQSETFRGLLVPLLAKSLDINTRQGFEEMNLALKQRVEEASV